jgi:hypothetical protein
VNGVVLKCREMTCPNPVFGLRGSSTFPDTRTPHLPCSPDSPSFDLPGSGEPIPQVSVIMRPISAPVHGGSLKLSELI